MSMSILIADDDPVIRRLFEKRLRDQEYNVRVAVDGVEAAGLLAHSHFDVVITDLVMPGDIGGIELLQIAKDKDPLTEVIVITAHSSIDTAVDAMKKGAVDYLEKPVNFDELFLRLEKIAQLKSLVRSADDLRNAMDITESSAAKTIQNLEITAADLQLKLDTIDDVLKTDTLPDDRKIKQIKTVVSG
ncbi:MAG TPA: sigma-54-dependent Fis family transcriptional regulator [Desulfobulbus sp.]|nr:sigma-54-dependent Fis family transcriptional regulator [Desulfobulbus sp.]